MENRKQPIIIFIGIVVLMSFFFQWIYAILSREEDFNIFDALADAPFILLLAFVDLWVVHLINKHFKYKNNIFLRVLSELILTFPFIVVSSVLVQYVFKAILSNPELEISLKPVLLVLLGNIIIILMLELFFYNRRQQEAAKHLVIVEKERAEYLYATLKNQINPHFLFNSLNVLSSLVFEEPQKANVFTKKLSNIYRYVLSTSILESVSVKEELNFLESYIFLLSIRFEKALKIHIDGDRDICRKIIPVSLQLLVENAIKHNVVSNEKPLVVDINITSGYIEVVNNLQPRMNVPEGGYGLNNLRRQYALHDKIIETPGTASRYVVRIPYL